MAETTHHDDRVLELRSQGHSYGAIAKTLGLDKASDAHDAFHRALRHRPSAEQAALRDQEIVRLDTLSRRLQALPHLTDNELAAQLLVVARLRDQLLYESDSARPQRRNHLLSCRSD